ncbi:MAG: DUF819 family protein [bacterium]|nr:DUF819 family protein [bacterium]
MSVITIVSLVFLCLFYVLFPACIIYACGRFSFLDKIGAAMLCYGAGILMSVLGLVPGDAAPIQKQLMAITVPLSIPLILFSTDIRRWTRLAGKTFLSLVCMITAVLIVASAGYALFHDTIPDAWKIAGMAIGVYTGGTPNLNAIGVALNTPEHIIVLANTSDMLACAPWFLFILSFAQRVLNKFLKPFEPAVYTNEDEPAAQETLEVNDYSGIFTRQKMIPLLKALFLAILIFAIGGGLYTVVPKEYNMAVLMLTITTLGILASLVPAVRRIPMTFQLGQYIILIFCLVVGSMADISKLFTSAPYIMIFITIVVYGSWIIHILLSKLFRIDTDTAIITSVSALFSPPFVPVAASALKNKEIVISGLSAGIIGYAIGNYLGIFYAYFLKWLGG